MDETTQLSDLGLELKAVRHLKGLSLNAVAEPGKISATYLQKLETGKVKSPSPRVLRRLAGVLDISYMKLMELAGYIVRDQADERAPGNLLREALIAEDLTEEELKAVAAFVAYLKEQRKKARAPA